MQLEDEPLLNYTSKQIMSESLNICLKSAESKINLVNNIKMHTILTLN